MIIPLDKPYGWSSFDAVRYVQRVARQATEGAKLKVGHAGTLDPLATGLLIICTGKDTKQIPGLQAGEKEYLAHVCLGAVTPSYDLETDVAQRFDYSAVTREQVAQQLAGMVGEQQQLPPTFSAKQVNGQRAYALARQGVAVEVKPATVHLYDLRLLAFDLPHLTLAVRCSKGTYIRSLAHDLGHALGCGAHLCGLRRTASGDFSIERSVGVHQLKQLL
jgi:tRNA pseudouridine55 synthase